MPTALKQFSIHELVAGLRQFPESTLKETEPVRQFLQETPVTADSLALYLTWDPQHYTRNLIDKTPLYELIAVCWEVGQASSVHNHRDQNCWMAVQLGRLHVENFHLVHQDLGAGKSSLEPLNPVERNISHPSAVDPSEQVHRVVNTR